MIHIPVPHNIISLTSVCVSACPVESSSVVHCSHPCITVHAKWRAVVSSTAHIPVSLLMPSGEQCRPLLTSLYHCSWALHQVHCTPALITPAVATCTIFMLAIADTVLKYLTHFHSYLNLPPYTPPPTPPPIPPPTTNPQPILQPVTHI